MNLPQQTLGVRLRLLVGNWDAKHPRTHKWTERYCGACDLINQLQRLLKEAGV